LGHRKVRVRHRAGTGLKIDPDTAVLSGKPDAPGKVDVAVTVTIDQELRKLDDGVLGWGNEKVVSTSMERVEARPEGIPLR
jgi:hypothetical protein